MTGQIKMTLLILNTVYARDTETQQFGDQGHTAVCINVSLFISLSDTRHTRKSQCIRQHKL